MTRSKPRFPVTLPALGDLGYRTGFLDAGDLVVAAIVEGPLCPALLYPACYLYRHGLELELKELVRDVQHAIELMGEVGELDKVRLREAAGLREQSKTLMGKHDLLQLLNHAVAWLRLLKYEELPPLVRATITKLHEVDPTGEAFRYGRSKDGKPTLGPEGWGVDLMQLQADVREAHRHLNGAGNYAVITGDQVHEYLSEMCRE